MMQYYCQGTTYEFDDKDEYLYYLLKEADATWLWEDHKGKSIKECDAVVVGWYYEQLQRVDLEDYRKEKFIEVFNRIWLWLLP